MLYLALFIFHVWSIYLYMTSSIVQKRKCNKSISLILLVLNYPKLMLILTSALSILDRSHVKCTDMTCVVNWYYTNQAEFKLNKWGLIIIKSHSVSDSCCSAFCLSEDQHFWTCRAPVPNWKWFCLLSNQRCPSWCSSLMADWKLSHPSLTKLPTRLKVSARQDRESSPSWESGWSILEELVVNVKIKCF